MVRKYPDNKGLSLIIITFLIFIAAAIIVAAYSILITDETITAGIELKEQQTLYIAEAGIERTMEYLEDDTNWSDNNGSAVLTENFGVGSYSIDLSSGTRTAIVVDSEAMIDSGPLKVTRKIRQKIRRLPEAFNYALFWNGTGSLNVNQGTVNVNGGDVFTKNTLSSTSPGQFNVADGGTPATTNGGFVYTTNSWTAGGTYTEGTKPGDEPSYPTLDTTFYDNEITTAAAQAAGNLTWTGGTQVLSGTTYVNGTITITGTTVTGSGALVATAKINIRGGASITSNSGGFMRLISKTDITIENSTTATNTVAYTRAEFEIENATLTGAFISSDKIKITNGSTVRGYLYADTLDLQDNLTVNGSCVTNRFSGNTISAAGKTVTINFDQSYLEEAAPGLGLDIDGDVNEDGVIIKVPGTWQQL